MLVIEDGNALFYALNDIPRNFKEISLKLFGMVSSKAGGRVETNLSLKVLAQRNQNVGKNFYQVMKINISKQN